MGWGLTQIVSRARAIYTYYNTTGTETELICVSLCFTVQLHVMQRTVLLPKFCPSVRQMRVLWQS